MANIQVKLRRGTDTEHNSFTGVEGEVTVDTTNDTLRVHDGSTAGGVRLAKLSEVSGGSGTVTSVGSGTGLTGGPITASGTLSLASIANLSALGNVSGSSAAPVAVAIKDEDDMASNSAIALATQQSIKTYVDSVVGSVDGFLSVSNWAEGSLTSSSETKAPDNDKSFAGIYVRSNQCHWSETATINYFTNVTTSRNLLSSRGW